MRADWRCVIDSTEGSFNLVPFPISMQKEVYSAQIELRGFNKKVVYTELIGRSIVFRFVGRLYSIGSHKSLMQSLESVAQKIMIPGVVINFDKFGPDPEELLNDGKSIKSRSNK